MTDILKIERHGDVSLLTLNRPDAMNSLDYPLYMALEDAIRASDARCIVITGAGERAFCAGDDVKQILSKGAPSTPEMAERAKATGGLTPAADALLHTDIPVIAAINGYALGWGAELAIMADMRVMAETAKFGEIFVTRGLCCDAPGLGRLAQIVGREQASELLFTGDVIDAARAKEIGLVGRVVPQAELLPTAIGLAQKIAANPPQAVQALKAGLRRTLDPDWRDTGKWAITEIRRLMQTEDAKESAAAFIEKRTPVFTGR
ncbi:enoyl-CoA hydratase/isomerase family protein [Henriciella litoralis]|uniref:enoyl-CoA hydratase/isomerase family protein n=1 Tax=Henriciella litoralis TaxID=568102 RepID=UPI000A01C4B4|nr:enoyl-CoA hydratase-related protein [Henriciella litoralis]